MLLLTPYCSDFKGIITPCWVYLQGIGTGLIAQGKGIVEYNFVGKDGKNVTIEASAYRVPDLRFQIFSPQSYFKNNKNAEFRMNQAGAYFIVNGERVELSYNSANLPHVCANNAGVEEESARIEANVCGSEDNTNLMKSGQLLLLWHQRLGHASFRLVRWLSRQGYLHGGTVVPSSDIIRDSFRIARATKRTNKKSKSLQQVPAGNIEYKSILRAVI